MEQAYYLSVPFPIEKAPTEKITSTDGGVKISKLLNYPVRGLVFEGGNTLQDLSNTVSDACMCLQDHNVPYNVLIADCGRRIFLFPQVNCFEIYLFCVTFFYKIFTSCWFANINSYHQLCSCFFGSYVINSVMLRNKLLGK